eukprot:scaffold101376_cov28-Tisochrysis_lutea.AAC.3
MPLAAGLGRGGAIAADGFVGTEAASSVGLATSSAATVEGLVMGELCHESCGDPRSHARCSSAAETRLDSDESGGVCGVAEAPADWGVPAGAVDGEVATRLEHGDAALRMDALVGWVGVVKGARAGAHAQAVASRMAVGWGTVVRDVHRVIREGWE